MHAEIDFGDDGDMDVVTRKAVIACDIKFGILVGAEDGRFGGSKDTTANGLEECDRCGGAEYEDVLEVRHVACLRMERYARQKRMRVVDMSACAICRTREMSGHIATLQRA